MRRRRKVGGRAGRIIPQWLSVEGAAVKIARMPWLYLLIAGVMEWGWPIPLKFAALPQRRLWAITLAIVSIILSGVFLFPSPGSCSRPTSLGRDRSGGPAAPAR